jgi:hypothetical protein
MSIFYVNLCYVSLIDKKQLFEFEFHTKGESFSEATAKTRKLIDSDYPEEILNKQFVWPCGWTLPGAKVEKRVKTIMAPSGYKVRVDWH